MKLVTVKEFHAMPIGTVYRIGEPWVFGSLSIKGQSCPSGHHHDWMEMEVGAIDASDSGTWGDMLEHALANPTDNHLPIDLYTEGRDGAFDDDRVVLVFEPADIDALIERLQKAKAGIDTYARSQP
jgi:hypothetical protein